MGVQTNYTLTIDGKARDTRERLEVVNPATGKVFETAPKASAQDLDDAVAAATRAQVTWRQTPFAERARLLRLAGEALRENADELARLFTLEQGRPLMGAKAEIILGADWMGWIADMEIPVEVTIDDEVRRVEVHHEPLGVVCAIVPWNFPVNLAMWKVAPALLAGNTMVLKPSPFTPLCSLRFGELFRDIFPPGVLNVISGGDELGPLMTAHPGFAKISFTGSTATGKRVMASAAPDLKRITLELGGNDAAIIMPDVDVEKVAARIFFGAFANTAQICIATKRLYVHEAIYDKLLDALTRIAEGTKVGDGLEQGVVLGPIQNRPQYNRVMELLQHAKDTGLRLLQGQEVPEEGYFVPVTIVDNPPEDSRVVVEEAFGPILPVLRFSDVDDVIERANNSEYGLAGAVWSADIDKAVEIAHRLETGTVWINENLNASPQTPFAGHKKSGFGVENGMAGLLEFTQPKAIYIPKAQQVA